MKNNINDCSLKPVIESLETYFGKINERFYNNELEKPVITVSHDDTAGAYGWCTSWRAWKDSEDEEAGYYEINICAEYLSRPFEEVFGTLMHEMVHLYNLQIGVKDTSRSGTYHNKNFKTAAEAHGLILEKDEKYGWIGRKLNDEAKEFMNSLNVKGFKLFREKPMKIKKASKSSSRKYVCPCCGLIVRATKEVKIICADCDVMLELEEA